MPGLAYLVKGQVKHTGKEINAQAFKQGNMVAKIPSV